MIDTFGRSCTPEGGDTRNEENLSSRSKFSVFSKCPSSMIVTLNGRIRVASSKMKSNSTLLISSESATPATEMKDGKF